MTPDILTSISVMLLAISHAILFCMVQNRVAKLEKQVHEQKLQLMLAFVDKLSMQNQLKTHIAVLTSANQFKAVDDILFNDGEMNADFNERCKAEHERYVAGKVVRGGK